MSPEDAQRALHLVHRRLGYAVGYHKRRDEAKSAEKMLHEPEYSVLTLALEEAQGDVADVITALHVGQLVDGGELSEPVEVHVQTPTSVLQPIPVRAPEDLVE